MGLANILRFVTSHPLNADHKLRAVARFVRWQIGSRILPGAAAVPWVNDARLLVRPGMEGATGNIYVGLHEFEDMAFVIHALGRGDGFVDVGANIGSYTILAGAVSGATCLSFEPVPATFQALVDNVNLNGLGATVTARNAGLGRERAKLRFTSSLDSVNHVVDAAEVTRPGETIEVDVEPLDEALGALRPVLMKIDVEGFETEVIAGATEMLARPTLLGVLMELNGSGSRYGFDEDALHRRMLELGFAPFAYAPFARTLTPLDGKSSTSGNTLYLRDVDAVRKRVEAAPKFHVQGTWI